MFTHILYCILHASMCIVSTIFEVSREDERVYCILCIELLVRKPAILLIKWLWPKGLKVCSCVEMYAEFKNQTLKKIGWYTKMLCATEYPGGRQFLKLALKLGTL